MSVWNARGNIITIIDITTLKKLFNSFLEVINCSSVMKAQYLK